MPLNLVESVAGTERFQERKITLKRIPLTRGQETDDMRPCPCVHGNLIPGHCVYCHHPSDETPRKCPIWSEYSYDPADPESRKHWHRGECEFFEPTEEKEHGK